MFRQTIGASALRPGTLQNVGWDGSELVAFRLHLPSRILEHNARDLETNEPSGIRRGNILAWEQHLTDRLDGRPVTIEVRMDSQSILYRTLWLFAGAFAAARAHAVALIWWTMRKGKEQEADSMSTTKSKCQLPSTRNAQFQLSALSSWNLLGRVARHLQLGSGSSAFGVDPLPPSAAR